MRTVNKAESFVTYAVNDRNFSHYGMLLAKHGLKSAAKKVNPMVFAIDVGLSVLDAFSRYQNYARECEVTEQMLHQNKLLKAQLAQQLRQMNLDLAMVKEESDVRLAMLERAARETKRSNQLFEEKTKQLLEQAQVMYLLVKKERERGVAFEQLQHLQKQLDNFIRTLIMHTVDCVDPS